MSAATQVHDRRADKPFNGDIAVVTIDDAFALAPLASFTLNDRQEIVPVKRDQVTAITSLRNDPLAKMLVRETIDRECYDAGRRWQFIYERAEVGSVSSIDPAKEAVDGGRIREVLTNRQAEAMAAMRKINAALTPSESTLLMAVLGESMFLADVARAFGWPQTWRQIQFLGAEFKKTLKKLSQVLDGVDLGRGLG